MKNSVDKSMMYNAGSPKKPYLSFYLNLTGIGFVLFYWDPATNQQNRPAIWRSTRSPISMMRVENYDVERGILTIKVCKHLITFIKVSEHEMVIAPESENTLKNITWLEKELILATATK